MNRNHTRSPQRHVPLMSVAAFAFTWWVQTPYAEFTEAWEAYSAAVGEAWSVSIED